MPAISGPAIVVAEGRNRRWTCAAVLRLEEVITLLLNGFNKDSWRSI